MCVRVGAVGFLNERERERERGGGGGEQFKLTYYCSCYNLLFGIPFLG